QRSCTPGLLVYIAACSAKRRRSFPWLADRNEGTKLVKHAAHRCFERFLALKQMAKKAVGPESFLVIKGAKQNNRRGATSLYDVFSRTGETAQCVGARSNNENY